MKPGKRQREILAILQDGTDDGETWTAGELYNDNGMWSVSSVASNGTRYGKRCPSDPARRLHEQGYVMYVRTDAGMGEYGADRAVFCLTDKGRMA